MSDPADPGHALYLYAFSASRNGMVPFSGLSPSPSGWIWVAGPSLHLRDRDLPAGSAQAERGPT